ncbi:hypothetical protein SMICM17S_07659 [Streptomyces microflavus]
MRHWGNVMPSSAVQSRDSVRALAPASRPRASRVRRSAGSARRMSQIRRRRGSDGAGSWTGCCGEAANRSSSTARRRRRSGLSSAGVVVWAMISSRSSGPTVSTDGASSPSGFSVAGRPRSRNSIAPWARWACTVPAGIQMARFAGAIHVPASVVTASTPRAA